MHRFIENFQFSFLSFLRLPCLIIIFLCGVSSSCGTAKFAGSDFSGSGGSGGGSSDDTAQNGTPVTWNWPCGSQTSSDTVTITNDTISGGGKFALGGDAANASAVAITFGGGFCPNAEPPRDILFVLDCTNSMARHDPVVGGTCGRLLAVEAVINQFAQAGNVRFAVETFAKNYLASSSGYFSTQQDLFNDILQTNNASNIADVFCYDALMIGTDYGFALGAAETMLQSARTDAMNDLLFVSDGEPTLGNDGTDQANAIKNSGVRISAVLVTEGDDTILKTDIASTDSLGFPMFTEVDDVSGLANALLGLINNNGDFSTLHYRGVGDSTWTTQVVFGGKNNTFSLSPVQFTKTKSPNGIETWYEYFQSGTQGEAEATGTLVWGD